jgi:hypothetical protein
VKRWVFRCALFLQIFWGFYVAEETGAEKGKYVDALPVLKFEM